MIEPAASPSWAPSDVSRTVWTVWRVVDTAPPCGRASPLRGLADVRGSIEFTCLRSAVRVPRDSVKLRRQWAFSARRSLWSWCSSPTWCG